MNEETVFSVNEMGMTHTDSNGKIWCQGQQMKLDETVINHVLMMSQYRVVLEKEESKRAQTLHKMEATSDHVKLPKACTTEASGCLRRDDFNFFSKINLACLFSWTRYQKLRYKIFLDLRDAF